MEFFKNLPSFGKKDDGKNEVLSPIEGLKPDEQKAGWGYIEKMNMTLNNLGEGLQCQ
jgi:hypothetical protein